MSHIITPPVIVPLLPTPSFNKMLTWTVDPAIANGSWSPGAGQAKYIKIAVSPGMVLTNAIVSVSTLGTAPANLYIGLYTTSGTRVAVTADFSGSLATGTMTVPFTTPYTVPAGVTVMYIGWLLGSATSNPTFASSSATNVNTGLITNSDLLRCWTAGSGLTALPSTVTPTSGVTASSTVYVCGLT